MKLVKADFNTGLYSIVTAGLSLGVTLEVTIADVYLIERSDQKIYGFGDVICRPDFPLSSLRGTIVLRWCRPIWWVRSI